MRKYICIWVFLGCWVGVWGSDGLASWEGYAQARKLVWEGKRDSAIVAYEQLSRRALSLDCGDDYLGFLLEIFALQTAIKHAELRSTFGRISDYVRGVSPPFNYHVQQGYCKLAEYYLLTNVLDSARVMAGWAERLSYERGLEGGRDDALSLRAKIYMKQEQYADALRLFKQSLALNIANNAPATDVSISYNNVGVVFDYQDMLDSALMYYEKGMCVLWDASGMYQEGIARGLFNIAGILITQGDLQTAMDYLELSEQIHVRLFGNKARNLADVYTSLSSIYLADAAYENALQYANKGIAIKKYLYETDESPHILFDYIKLAQLYFKMGKPVEAKHVAFLAQRIAQKYKFHQNEAMLNMVLFDLFFENGQTDSAAICINKALPLTDGYDYLKLDTYMRMAALQLSLHNIPQAQTYATYAEALIRRIGIDNSPSMTNCQLLYAQIRLKAHDYTAATQYAQNVLDNTKNLDKISHLKAITLLLKAADAMGNYPTAIQAIREGMQYIHDTKSLYILEADKIQWAQQSSDFHHAAVPIAYQHARRYANQTDSLALLFSIMEADKANILLSAVNARHSQQLLGLPDSVTNRTNQLTQNIAYLQKEYDNAAAELSLDPAEGASAQQYLFQIQNDIIQQTQTLEQHHQHIRQAYPQYFSLVHNYQNIAIPDAQKRLQPDQSIIEYTITDSTLYALVISKQQVAVQSIPITRNALRQLVYQARDSIQIRSKNYTPYTAQLYQILIAPVQSYLRQSLLIVPDDFLSLLPFEVLHPPVANNTSPQFILYQHPICYNYSATLWAKDSPPPIHTTQQTVLGIAPIHFNVPPPPDSLSIQPTTYSPLPATATELQNIAKHTTTRNLLLQDATEAHFRQLATQATIIHFATHGEVNDQNPLYSRLLFNNDDTTSQLDNILHAYEIYNLPLHAQLVILSACNTGTGKVNTGEGVMSLARGFSYAGCPNIAMTAWRVADQSMSDLTDLLYTHLFDRNLSKERAIQQTKIDFLQSASPTKQHPFYWANLLLIGNANNLNLPSAHPSSTPIFYTLALLIATTVLFLAYRRYHQNK